MGRILNEREHASKRSEIIDAAMALVYTRGYEQMTIQDILDALQISRGAFYHYFDSKIALLEAFIERSAAEAEKDLVLTMDDPQRTALQKIQGYFDWSTRWKTTHLEPVARALRSWYADENALIRQKTMTRSLRSMSRILGPVIRQGIAEGTFTTTHPAEVAVMFAGITLSLSDTLVDLMLNPREGHDSLREAQGFLDAYFHVIERILGAPAGSFTSIDAGVFSAWFAPKGVSP
jgi:TetR/AcrR family transcriptional regulator, transcriptional repressor for nem operon